MSSNSCPQILALSPLGSWPTDPHNRLPMKISLPATRNAQKQFLVTPIHLNEQSQDSREVAPSLARWVVDAGAAL